MRPTDDERSVPRDHEASLSEHVEAILEETAILADGDHKYPVRREELATEYADHVMDLPNETESLGSVFDRLVDERYESPVEAREAVLNELTGRERNTNEYNDQRDIDPLAADTDAVGAVEDGDTEE